MILIAGASGLVGSSLVRLCKFNHYDYVGISSKDLNLLDRNSTFKLLKKLKPEIVIDAAARAGGIKANDTFPVNFLTENIQIQTNLMDAAHESGVNKFIFLGSSCIYPRNCAQPIKEDYLMSGKLENTNSAYAIAKIAGIELIKSYRKQYSHSWVSLMPTNLYGPNDNFNLETGHVIPALINRFFNAKQNRLEVVKLWGSGTALREFLFVDDLAEAIFCCIEKFNSDKHINIGSNEEITVRDLALLIKEITGYDGKIEWDLSMPDGTPRKILDSSLIRELGWKPKTNLREGLKKTLDYFENNFI